MMRAKVKKWTGYAADCAHVWPQARLRLFLDRLMLLALLAGLTPMLLAEEPLDGNATIVYQSRHGDTHFFDRGGSRMTVRWSPRRQMKPTHQAATRCR